MNRDLALAEWKRAQQSMRAAQLLTAEKCFADAISRTYYAVLHAAKAALHAEGVTADTHTAVRRMFGLHLIKPGHIEKEFAAQLGESFDDRLAADYDAEVTFSGKEARHECRQTRRFLSRVRHFLLDKGFKAKELRKSE
jgi:uncharacterized protein (UPF0332 family)